MAPFELNLPMFYLIKTKIMGKLLVLSENEAHHGYVKLNFLQKEGNMNFLHGSNGFPGN